jgi:L-ascorbate metabolism protein UlaG (beta-lactamase superfamily)
MFKAKELTAGEKSIAPISRKGILRKIMMYLLIIIVALCVTIALYINLHPVFGGTPTKAQQDSYKKLDHYVDGKFVNQVPTSMMDTIFSDNVSMVKESLSGGKDRKPARQLPVSEIDWKKMNSEHDSVTWLGHSAFFVSIDNKKMLVDPMLGPIASPVSFAGSKRYTGSLLHIIDEMPPIDAVLITHDHYDHLDYASIKKLKSKVNHFFVPLGVGAHLTRWGVDKNRITELNWWDETEFQGLTLALTPSRHFSGRGLFNRNSTLWGGWVILGKNTRFYTSGDGGYGDHFKEIGNKYGPFDITLIEGGQYDRRWAWVHMTPEQAVQAHQDVKGKNMMLIHWGGFTLAYHGWTEPIERALAAAKEKEVKLIAPELGETKILDSDLDVSNAAWWDI